MPECESVFLTGALAIECENTGEHTIHKAIFGGTTIEWADF